MRKVMLQLLQHSYNTAFQNSCIFILFGVLNSVALNLKLSVYVSPYIAYAKGGGDLKIFSSLNSQCVNLRCQSLQDPRNGIKSS